MTPADLTSLKQLVLKNDSATGDLFLEGTIRQVKGLLKSYLIVKPSCMFDSKIEVKFKVSYFENGKFNEKNTREVSVNLAQVQARKQEKEFQQKYRFLVQEDAQLRSLYSLEKAAPGGAGDLIITISGLPGSGFEYCDATQQTLARGS